MEFFLPFIIAIIVFLFVIIFVSKVRDNKAKIILSTLQMNKLNVVEIKFSQTSFNNFKQFGGMFTNANLYFDEERKILVFTTKKNAISSVFNNNLPIVLVNDSLESLPKYVNYRVVYETLIRSDEYILVIKDGFSKVKYEEITLFSEKNEMALKNIIAAFKS